MGPCPNMMTWLESFMLWNWFQLLIIGLVMSANVYWQVTPNKYLASIAGVVVAYLVTVALSKLIELLSLRRRRHDRATQ
jgi:hypothetical protein